MKRTPTGPAAWLHHGASRAAYVMWRRSVRRGAAPARLRVPREGAPVTAASPDEDITHKILAQELLAQLPRRSAGLLWRHVACGETLHEAGAAYGLTAAGAQHVIGAACAQLRRACARAERLCGL